MIKTNENQYAAGMMCRVMKVSRSGYYDWRHRPLSERGQADQVLATEIKRVFDDEKGRPGSPRITRRLREEGRLVGRHRVARIIPAGHKCVTTAGGRKRPRSTKPRPTATIPCRLPLTSWNKISLQMPPTKNGCLASLTFGLTRAGCIWRGCWSFIPVGSLVGQSPNG